jgi:hypothetical protein
MTEETNLPKTPDELDDALFNEADDDFGKLEDSPEEVPGDERLRAADRESLTREADRYEDRIDDAWLPQSILPTPKKRPGLVHRYIRTAMNGTSDVRNVSKRFREGWTPVKRVDYPEIADIPNDVDSRYPDGIEIGGSLLCCMPEEMANKRRAYFANKSKAELEAVDSNLLANNDPRTNMRIQRPQRNTRVSRSAFGNRR